MNRIEVVSSMFKSVGYDPEAQVLEVEFQPKKNGETGNVYQYADVPKETWDAFRLSTSHGKYFLACIKPEYAAKKVEPTTTDSGSAK